MDTGQLVLQVWERIEKHWPSFSGLFFTSILAIIVLFILSTDGNIENAKWIHLIPFAVVQTIILVLWSAYRRIPRTPKSHIGFIVAIATYDKKHTMTIKRDLIDTLKKYLPGNNEKIPFKLITLNEYYSKKIQDGVDPKFVLEKSKAHFIIHGRCRLANYNKSPQYILEIHGAVAHTHIYKKQQAELKSDFRQALLKRWRFQEDVEANGFEVASQHIAFVAPYMLSLAALYSGDPYIARDLMYRAKNIAPRLSVLPVSVQAVVRKIPGRLADIHYYIAERAYYRWRSSRDSTHLVEAREHATISLGLPCEPYPLKILMSICYFVLDSDIESALDSLKGLGNVRDQTWRLDVAFLEAMRGNLSEVKKQYQIAKRGSFPAQIPNETESFILWYLEDNSTCYQLYYLLGLINLYFKKDFVLAEQELRIFLKHCGDKKWRSAERHTKALLESYFRK